MSYTERLFVSKFSYMKADSARVYESKTFGPMVHGWTLHDGTDDPQPHELTQVVVDLAEDGHVIGVEFLVDTELEYEVQSEHNTPGPYCMHSMFDITCIPCAHRHLWLLQQPSNQEPCTVADHMDAATSGVACVCQTRKEETNDS